MYYFSLDSVSSEKRNKFIIEVNTVDSFQGQERDVVIMSCVRSSGIGFMSDKQRLCVALTRAKSSLILCGNFKTFQVIVRIIVRCFRSVLLFVD